MGLSTLLATLRGPRIGPFTAFDLLGSLAIALVISRRLGTNTPLIAVLPLSVVAHLIAGSDTPLTKMVKSDNFTGADLGAKIGIGALSLFLVLRRE